MFNRFIRRTPGFNELGDNSIGQPRVFRYGNGDIRRIEIRQPLPSSALRPSLNSETHLDILNNRLDTTLLEPENLVRYIGFTEVPQSQFDPDLMARLDVQRLTQDIEAANRDRLTPYNNPLAVLGSSPLTSGGESNLGEYFNIPASGDLVFYPLRRLARFNEATNRPYDGLVYQGDRVRGYIADGEVGFTTRYQLPDGSYTDWSYNSPQEALSSPGGSFLGHQLRGGGVTDASTLKPPSYELRQFARRVRSIMRENPAVYTNSPLNANSSDTGRSRSRINQRLAGFTPMPGERLGQQYLDTRRFGNFPLVASMRGQYGTGEIYTDYDSVFGYGSDGIQTYLAPGVRNPYFTNAQNLTERNREAIQTAIAGQWPFLASDNRFMNINTAIYDEHAGGYGNPGLVSFFFEDRNAPQAARDALARLGYARAESLDDRFAGNPFAF